MSGLNPRKSSGHFPGPTSLKTGELVPSLPLPDSITAHLLGRRVPDPAHPIAAHTMASDSKIPQASEEITCTFMAVSYHGHRISCYLSWRRQNLYICSTSDFSSAMHFHLHFNSVRRQSRLCGVRIWPRRRIQDPLSGWSLPNLRMGAAALPQIL